MKQIIFFGRQPALGYAELVAQVGARDIQKLTNNTVLCTTELEPNRFGGITQIGHEVARIPGRDWLSVIRWLEQHIHSIQIDKKINVSVATGDLKLSTTNQQRSLLDLKKRLKQAGISARVVMPKGGQLNAAQILANKLTQKPNLAIVPLQTKKDIVLVLLTWVQDINSYADRDYGRPHRDSFVGMLPPKLAQIMLNLAIKPELAQTNPRILDPFCGTGVVLQEAVLHGYQAYGTDISSKMVEYSRKNLQWLADQTGTSHNAHILVTADATTHTWQQPINAVVGETYLGEPQTSIPTPQKLQKLQADSTNLLSSFLKNLASQLEPGTPLCLAVPAWRTKQNTWVDSPVIDQINRLGYTRMSFPGVNDDDLLYYRSDQYVARRLLPLKRKS